MLFRSGERHLEVAVGHGRGAVLIQPFRTGVLDDVIVTTTAGEDSDKRNANDQWFFRKMHVLIPSYGAHKDAELRQQRPRRQLQRYSTVVAGPSLEHEL